MSADTRTIISPANPIVKKIRSLQQKKYRDEEGQFVVEGLRHVHDAVVTGWLPQILAYAEDAKHDPLFNEIINACRAAQTDIIEVTDEILQKITNRDNAQKLIGVFGHKWHALKDIGVQELWVGLDGVRDPGNLGTIIRTADAVGAKGVLLAGSTCDPWSPEVIRATMGSFARIKIVHANIAEVTAWKKTWNGKMIGTHLDTVHDYRKVDYTMPLLLMMGSEQSGLSLEMAKSCDTLVKIPMSGGTESLNLAVSTGIMLYEICRNRL